MHASPSGARGANHVSERCGDVVVAPLQEEARLVAEAEAAQLEAEQERLNAMKLEQLAAAEAEEANLRAQLDAEARAKLESVTIF
jgi:hypothetical protein